MYVNTSVVKALMYLRNVSAPELANLTHTPLLDLQTWLDARQEEDNELVPFSVQMEVLKLLGIDGEAPRADVVHYWRTYEPLFSRPEKSYWALGIMLKAFGRAQAVFIAREADPSWSTKAVAHFGLRFQGFMAILEVRAHPLKSLSFDPERLPDLSWVPETFGVLLPEAEYLAMEPGSMKVRGMTQYLAYTSEMNQWERLREAAIEHGLHAEQVAQMLLGEELVPRIAGAARSTEEPAVVPPSEPVLKTAPKGPSIQELRAGNGRTQQDDLDLFVTPVTPLNRAAERAAMSRAVPRPGATSRPVVKKVSHES